MSDERDVVTQLGAVSRFKRGQMVTTPLGRGFVFEDQRTVSDDMAPWVGVIIPGCECSQCKVRVTFLDSSPAEEMLITHFFTTDQVDWV